MFCKECGHNLEGAEVIFCPECGTKTEQPEIKETDTSTASPADTQRQINAKNSFIKKNFIAVIAGVAAVVAIFVIITALNLRSFNPPYEVISFGRYDEIIYVGNGRFFVSRGSSSNMRWGVVDVRGSELIDFGRFDEHFSETVYDGDFILTVRDGRDFIVLSADGSEIASFDRFDHVRTVTANRFIVETGSGQNTRAGVIDANSTEIIPLGRYSSIRSSDNGRWFTVWDGERVGLINASGAEVIPLGRYDNISFAPNDRFIVSVGPGYNRRFAVLDSRGQEIISLGRFDNIRAAGDSHFIVRSGASWGVVNSQGNEVIPFRYDSIHIVDGNNFIVTEGDRRGVLDARGIEVISMGRYDEITYAFGGRFLVRSGGESDSWTGEMRGARWGVVDARGNEVITLGRYDEITPVPGDRFIVRTGGTFNRNVWEWEGARFGVVDAQGNEVISAGRYDSILNYYRYFMAEFAEVGFAIDNNFIVRSGDRIGVRGINGEEIIPLGRYDEVHLMHDGLAIVTSNGRIGVINSRRIDD